LREFHGKPTGNATLGAALIDLGNLLQRHVKLIPAERVFPRHELITSGLTGHDHGLTRTLTASVVNLASVPVHTDTRAAHALALTLARENHPTTCRHVSRT